VLSIGALFLLIPHWHFMLGKSSCTFHSFSVTRSRNLDRFSCITIVVIKKTLIFVFHLYQTLIPKVHYFALKHSCYKWALLITLAFGIPETFSMDLNLLPLVVLFQEFVDLEPHFSFLQLVVMPISLPFVQHTSSPYLCIRIWSSNTIHVV
jgi:hypothetical protein